MYQFIPIKFQKTHDLFPSLKIPGKFAYLEFVLYTIWSRMVLIYSKTSIRKYSGNPVKLSLWKDIFES